MKNIHLLSTDKPSRLHKIGNELGLTTKPNSNFLSKQQNIYITSDEDIDENDYIITKDGRLVEVSYLLSKDLEGASKVVLTTDELYIHNDLIPKEYNTFPQYIQKIDDEFLEWFVNNPSCEKVKWDAYPISPNGNIVATNKPYPFEGLVSNFKISYKIIIPKEEPNYNMKQEILAEMERLEEKPKQEILEEAAITYSELLPFVDEIVTDNSRLDFIAGAKWQAERMYSEEEVESLLHKFMQYQKPDWHWWSTHKWFEQSKKKQ